MNHRFKKILLAVVACHLFGLVVLAFWTFFTPPQQLPQKISVRMIAINEQPPQPKSSQKPPQPPQPKEEKPSLQLPIEEEEKKPEKTPEKIPEKKPRVKKSSPPQKTNEKPIPKEVKKQIPKKDIPKKPFTTPPPPKVETSADIKKNEERCSLLLEAKEKLSRTATATPTKRSASLSLPDQIEPLSVETLIKGPVGKDVGYVSSLISLLKQQMTLPERGDVELLLTLNRAGKIVKATVVRSQSVSNKNYVLKRLPELSYPSFDNYFDKMDAFEFEITLRGT